MVKLYRVTHLFFVEAVISVGDVCSAAVVVHYY